jgi:hypothetical protein
VNFPPDRFEHALEVYAYFHGRECSPVDVTRFLEKDTRLAPSDHLLARKVDRMLRFVGVVTEGCTVVDMSEGPPTWAIRKVKAKCIARLYPRGRRVPAGVDDLILPK